MSRARLAVLVLASSAMVAGPAIAQEPPSSPLDVSLRAGYGTQLTTGLSSLGWGTGPTVGYTILRHVRLEVAGLWSAGHGAHAANATLAYDAQSASFRATAGAAYDVAFGAFHLRPGLRAGATYIYGYTRVGPWELSDDKVLGLVGPSLALLVRTRSVEVGLDGEGLFLPRWVGAPIFGVYLFAGVRL